MTISPLFNSLPRKQRDGSFVLFVGSIQTNESSP
jgi:hypothetical protein